MKKRESSQNTKKNVFVIIIIQILFSLQFFAWYSCNFLLKKTKSRPRRSYSPQNIPPPKFFP